MVVIVMVALLATLAIPSMSEARSDRVAFDYARQFQQILVQGRSRAAGTGAAHLAILTSYTGATHRGSIRLYAALDGEPKAPLNLVGPNPVASCKTLGQWTTAAVAPAAFAAPAARIDPAARFIDFSDLTRTGINDDMDVRADLVQSDGSPASTATAANYLAVCITPAGVTYLGYGNTPINALNVMRSATPFTGVAEVRIQRHRAGVSVGLRRRVMMTGGGAPRLRSE